MPPVEAHAPIEMTHLGSAIWSYTWRSTGAIFCDTRPATIMRSAWRGDARNTSMPNRARSLCAAPVAIISIAQHARPNEAGHIDLVRAQLTALSSIAVRKLEGTSAPAIKEPSCNVALSGTKG